MASGAGGSTSWLVLCVLSVNSFESRTFLAAYVCIDNLHFLEELALPMQIREELGFPDNIDLVKMEKLRSMKQIKRLFPTLENWPTWDLDADFTEMIAKVSGSNFREMVHLPSKKLNNMYYLNVLD